MASSKIKGITIEIGGNTTKLQEALKGVDKQIYSLNGDLKALNQALKLDPKNTELLSQKQEVLARNIAATKDKLDTLKEAQRQMGSYAKLTDEQKTSYNQLSLEIAKSENALKSMNNEMKSMSKIDLSSLKEGLKKAGEVALSVAKTIAAAVGAIAAAIGKVLKDAVQSYASYEQNVGGIQKLFGESADQVIADSKRAYKEAGLSANQYMETATSFSASLLKGLGGDTKKAAALTNRAIKDMADNANTFGTSMDDVMNVYKALSKEQFTTLDNLKLGYAGTKTGMQQLIKDAASYKDIQKELGITVDKSSMSFDNMINAISVIQSHLNITGTTMKEAEGTITGSLNMMRAAFDNFINGSGSPEDLSKSISSFLKNVLGALKKLAPGIIKGLVDLFKTLVPELASMVGELLPIIVDGAKELIQGLIDFINNDSEQFIDMAISMLMNLVTFILDNLPILLQASIKMIAELARGLAKAAPTLIPTIVDTLLLMVDTIIDNLDLMVDASLELILALTDGIFKALPKLIEKLPELVIKLKETLIEQAPKMLLAAAELIAKLGEGLWEGIKSIVDIGKKLVEGLWEGIKSMGNWLWDNLKSFGEGILDFLGGIFGIASPSKEMRWQGQMLGEGLALGIEDTIGEVEKAMSNLSSGVEASVNPTINPTANSNPLYITIDKFFNNRDTDVQQLAEELEFYRKNTALAKGGV